jgi:hypothetical protein
VYADDFRGSYVSLADGTDLYCDNSHFAAIGITSVSLELVRKVKRSKAIPADRLCGLVVRVLGYRSGGPGSIPGTTRFSEKKNERKQ